MTRQQVEMQSAPHFTAAPNPRDLHCGACATFTTSNTLQMLHSTYASTLHMLHPIHLHLQQVVVQHYIHYKTTSTTKLHLHHGACSRMWWCKQRGPRLHPRKQGLFSYSVKPWKYWKKNCSFSLFPEHSSNGMKLNWVNRSRETCFQDKLLFL